MSMYLDLILQWVSFPRQNSGGLIKYDFYFKNSFSKGSGFTSVVEQLPSLLYPSVQTPTSNSGGVRSHSSRYCNPNTLETVWRFTNPWVWRLCLSVIKIKATSGHFEVIISTAYGSYCTCPVYTAAFWHKKSLINKNIGHWKNCSA